MSGVISGLHLMYAYDEIEKAIESGECDEQVAEGLVKIQHYLLICTEKERSTQHSDHRSS